jgi:hypothetical protein
MPDPVIITTRLGARINIEIVPEEPRARVDAYSRVFQRKFPRNILRVPTTSRYNCTGMLFALRRGFVGDMDISRLLEDDGYRRVSRDEDPVAGDIVIWGSVADVEHVGLIVECREATGLDFCVPVVVSKWGSGPEYIHQLGDSPFEQEPVYYTERP